MAEIDGAAEFRKRLAAITDTRQMVGTVALRAVAEAKAIVPRKTGNLGRTIRIGRVTAESAEVLAGGRLKVGYARAVEFGTKPHIIRPRKAKVLAWGGARRLSGNLRSGSKATNFASMVRHPGSRAKPYLIPGIRTALRLAGFRTKIVDAWNRAA